MCGIAGIVAPDSRSYANALDAMVGALQHRGPDGSGTHFFRNCALGHARLSIIDPKGGHQPMLSHDGSAGLTFNGEIYGYQPIRRDLAGYPFRTTSDTEVILALHDRHGARMMPHLPGMFAFALWDDRREELFCARDRFGEKPFYYAFGRRGEFVFASELKALLAADLFTPVLSRESFTHYLQRGYVHPSRTIYGNVHNLPPAHCLRVRAGRVEVERYWSLPEPDQTIGLAEAAEQFRGRLDTAVRRQLVADVPVGAFLSGGLDSSTIVAVASRHQQKLRTFSFGYEDKLNELPYARAVADRYDTDHTELQPGPTDLAALIQEMATVYDEPFSDSSSIPTYLLCREARRHLKVVLTGDGGDELMAGYESWYRPLLWMETGRDSPAWAHGVLRVAAALAERSSYFRGLRHATRGMLLGRRYRSVSEAHRAEAHFFNERDLTALGLEGAVGPTTFRPTFGTVDDALRMDLEDYMPGDILVKIDRAAMAHGLELRAPFLDIDFASFCAALPHRLKINTRSEKIILRNVHADSWPRSVRTRSKQGFGAPVRRWLASAPVRALRREYLDDPRRQLFELIDFEASKRFSESTHHLWMLLVLSIWMESHSFEVPGREPEAVPAHTIGVGFTETPRSDLLPA